MIVINEAGLTESERLSVHKPLAPNIGDDRDLSDLGSQMLAVISMFEAELTQAVDSIDCRPVKASS